MTGHKSVTSLENYAEADISVQRAMAKCVVSGAEYSAKHKKVIGEPSGTTITFNIQGCTNVTINNMQ